MNPYKLKALVEYLGGKTSMLQNPIRCELDLDELLAGFGLKQLLTSTEQHAVKRELYAKLEDDTFMKQLRSRVE